MQHGTELRRVECWAQILPRTEDTPRHTGSARPRRLSTDFSVVLSGLPAGAELSDRHAQSRPGSVESR